MDSHKRVQFLRLMRLELEPPFPISLATPESLRCDLVAPLAMQHGFRRQSAVDR